MDEAAAGRRAAAARARPPGLRRASGDYRIGYILCTTDVNNDVVQSVTPVNLDHMIDKNVYIVSVDVNKVVLHFLQKVDKTCFVFSGIWESTKYVCKLPG